MAHVHKGILVTCHCDSVDEPESTVLRVVSWCRKINTVWFPVCAESYRVERRGSARTGLRGEGRLVKECHS